MRDSSISTLLSLKRTPRAARGERELALITIDQITVATLGILALLLNLQAFLSNNPTSPWKFVFALLSVSCWLQGTWHVRSSGSQYAFVPLLLVFLITPLASEPWVIHSWTSYGLIIVTTAVYFSAFPSRFLSFASLLVCLVLQAASVELNFRGITDTSDLSYSGTYFSTSWVLLVGVMLFIIRRQYLNYCDEIDLELVQLEEQARARSRNIRLLNSQDFQNLKMHGTVLNTLLVVQSNLENQVNNDQALALLSKELDDLGNSELSLRSLLQERIVIEFQRNALRNTEVKLNEFSLPTFDSSIELQLLEVCREMLVNFNRHTPATKVEITGTDLHDGNCQLVFSENSPEVMKDKWDHAELISAMKSKTMDRLIRGINGDWKLELKGNQLVHTVTFANTPFAEDPAVEIKKLRGASFDLIRGSFPLISILYGLIILPAVFYWNHFTLTNFVLFGSIIAAGIAFKLNAQNRLRVPLALIASILGLLVLPLAERHIKMCADLKTMPWIFNGLLAPILLISVLTNKAYLKWMPLLIFTLEAVLSTKIFPESCHQILQGSTPGLFLIGTSALLIGSARNRAKNRDDLASLGARNQDIAFDLLDVQLADTREKLLKSLGELSLQLTSGQKAREDSLHIVTLEVQKIRAFLLCSEYFELDAMRYLNKSITERINAGQSTKLTLSNPEVFEDFDEELVQVFGIIFEEAKSGPLQILLLGAAIPEVHLQTDSRTVSRIQRRLADEPPVLKLVFN
jgi:hypothetical protein